MHILKLDVSGLPISFVTWEAAAHLMANSKVVWSMGDTAMILRGGINRDGIQSILELPPIISVKDKSQSWAPRNSENQACRKVIYARDEGICMYCGEFVTHRNATLDHIYPKSRGGEDTYQNLCLSCCDCNTRKANKTPEEAGMSLLAVPYAPNPAAKLILSGRAVMVDQMDYLIKYANLRSSLKVN